MRLLARKIDYDVLPIEVLEDMQKEEPGVRMIEEELDIPAPFKEEDVPASWSWSLVERLRTLLCSLEKKEKKILSLVFRKNLSQQEVGRRMNMSEEEVDDFLGKILFRLQCEMLSTGEKTVQ